MRLRYVLSRTKGATYTFVSREGGVQTFTGHPWPKGDGRSECGIAGTVAIGDRNSEGVYSWDSAEGLGKSRLLYLYRTRMLRL